jgi:spore maturation protein CgeB
MQLDHPCVMHTHLINAPRNLTILTHDANYEHYLKTYYGDKVRSALLPPGGEPCGRFWDEKDKPYDLTFVGTYHGFTDWIPELKVINRKTHGLARKLVHEMKHRSNDTYEVCFERILNREHLNYSLEQKRELMHECRATYCCVMNYYRQKIIKVILDAGIELHVYGDTWKKKEWAGYSNLQIHEAVEGSAVMDIYAKSRISLNIMSWHKAGMTERIANMMLSKTVVLTDKSDYLTEHFTDGTDIVFFDLEQLERLPETIKTLLSDAPGRKMIAEAGYRNALEHHTWKVRARQFYLGIVSNIPNIDDKNI